MRFDLWLNCAVGYINPLFKIYSPKENSTFNSNENKISSLNFGFLTYFSLHKRI